MAPTDRWATGESRDGWLSSWPMSGVDRRGYEIRRFGAADWRRVRDLRLEMLADSPLAYVESLADAKRRTDDEWRARAAWADGPRRLGLAAVLTAVLTDVLTDEERWIAQARAGAFADRDNRAYVFNVYVTPGFRGAGVADDLLDHAERWAREQAHPALFLFVHEHNARAIAFYRRRGYQFTDAREPYLYDPSQSELEMRLLLR